MSRSETVRRHVQSAIYPDTVGLPPPKTTRLFWRSFSRQRFAAIFEAKVAQLLLSIAKLCERVEGKARHRS